ncbi:uncharacterized protein LOC126678195 [Mercurialis annua]|uniref:uncharacterized protein LOC126678195 n=1 Tax=Mercurialis annua TaxID=3986 RepID=UPI00215ECB9C|nr:uncharacterized protein LOC126678195 [Mercurialis annua]
MEELGYLWSYQEGIDEMKQKLLYTTIELETLKVEATEEMRKHKEDVKQLIDLLKNAYKERDEAKDQLQKLLNKLLPESSPILPPPQSESPPVFPMKANSSITESNSSSATYNHHSVDSMFDGVASPDFSSINMADSSKTYVQESYNLADAAIDNLVKGKLLPEKGKLLQAVTEAGPLLQTLLVAGPLPRWRNPPPLQTFRIPPVSIKSCENAKMSTTNKRSLNSASYSEMYRGSSQMCSAAVFNFSNGASGSGLGNGWSLNSGGINQVPAGKRQRFH